MAATKKRRRKARRKPAERTSSRQPESPFASNPRPRVDLRLAYGSIAEVDAEAVVLGLFQGVQDLPGATSAVDRRIGGAITDIIERRMFSGRVGEVFIFPAVRQDIRAEFVILAGMGRFDRFDHDVLEIVAENVARTLVRAKVGDFAMALFGASRSKNLYYELAHLTDGFFRGVSGSRQRNPLRS